METFDLFNEQSINEEYDPKFTKDEFVEKAKPIFNLIIDAYTKSHVINEEEDETKFDTEKFTSMMEDIMFNDTDFLDLLEGRFIDATGN